MYTETELREALTYSATRADALVPDLSQRPTPHRRRWTVPLAAAASVLAVAGIAVALTGSGADRQAAVGRATADPGPATRGAPASARPTIAPLPAHTPARLTGVVALAGAAAPDVTYDLAGDSSGGAVERMTRDLGGNRMVVVYAVPASSGLDPQRIPRNRPVSVDGRTGYYSRFRLFPVAGGDGRGKYTSAWTLAVPGGSGSWVFAEVDRMSSSLDAPSAIVRAYEGLRVRMGSEQVRLPLRTGYLPAGLAVGGLEASTSPSGTTSIAFYRGTANVLSIDVLGSAQDSGGPACSGCGVAVHRSVDAMRVSVSSGTYARAVLTRVLNTLTVRSDPSGWFSVRAALG